MEGVDDKKEQGDQQEAMPRDGEYVESKKQSS